MAYIIFGLSLLVLLQAFIFHQLINSFTMKAYSAVYIFKPNFCIFFGFILLLSISFPRQ